MKVTAKVTTSRTKSDFDSVWARYSRMADRTLKSDTNE